MWLWGLGLGFKLFVALFTKIIRYIGIQFLNKVYTHCYVLLVLSPTSIPSIIGASLSKPYHMRPMGEIYFLACLSQSFLIWLKAVRVQTNITSGTWITSANHYMWSLHYYLDSSCLDLQLIYSKYIQSMVGNCIYGQSKQMVFIALNSFQ